MKRNKIIILVFFTFASQAWAQPPKYSNEFLSIGVGARALGMGNVHAAVARDITAAYWNPAGLTGITADRQVSFMHNEHFAGIVKYDYGAIGFKLDTSKYLAVSLIRMGVDDIPNTLELIDENGNINYSNIKSFSIADYAFVVSYAKRLSLFGLEGLRMGGNAKIIHRKIGEFGKGWGFGVDVGAQYTYKSWDFGIMARDITTTFTTFSYTNSDILIETFTKTGNEIPENSIEITLPRLILGVSRKFNIKEKFTINPAVDFDVTFDGKRNVLIKSNLMSIDPHIGLEMGYKGIIFLRAGMSNIQKSTDSGNRMTTIQPNMGVGVNIKTSTIEATIDYAMTNISQSVGLYSNVFSLKIGFNKKAKE